MLLETLAIYQRTSALETPRSSHLFGGVFGGPDLSALTSTLKHCAQDRRHRNATELRRATMLMTWGNSRHHLSLQGPRLIFTRTQL